MNTHAIRNSAEYQRICALPRRPPVDLDALAAELTSVLRTPNGRMSLRPVQALALHDIGTVGGLTAPIRVGGGKTLVSLLAPHVLQSTRPLLLLPASLIGKTADDRRRLSTHWLIPRHIKVMSYEALGRSGAAEELERYRADLIIADEAHKLKNPRAACTKRVMRYMAAHPETKMIVMSGSLIKHSIKDFAPMCVWALKDGAPVPIERGELEDWANALDERGNPLTRVHPGVLGDDVESARLWFQDRFLNTPGVVGSAGEGVQASLYINAFEFNVNPVTEHNFEVLRSTWCTPDGWAYSMATDIWRCARELALGLHYVWDPRPPDEWLEARKEWASWCRDRIEKSMWTDNPLDSELQVVNAVDSGVFKWCEEGKAILDDWRKIKPTFTVNSKPIWHDDSALNACGDWMENHHGIVWCEHTFFAAELARRTSLPYYGPGGLDPRGNRIEAEKGDRSVVASVAANGTGRNLQMFHENLITSFQPGADTNEQLLGRTHRDGQEADTVTVDVVLACAEHMDAMRKAMADARMHEEVTGQPQKLLLADITWPDERKGTSRWSKSV